MALSSERFEGSSAKELGDVSLEKMLMAPIVNVLPGVDRIILSKSSSFNKAVLDTSSQSWYHTYHNILSKPRQ